MTLTIESTGIRHTGCDGTYEPIAEDMLSCYCGALMDLTAPGIDPSVISVVVLAPSLEDC